MRQSLGSILLAIMLASVQVAAQEVEQRGIATVSADEEKALEPVRSEFFDRSPVLPVVGAGGYPANLNPVEGVMVTSFFLRDRQLLPLEQFEQMTDPLLNRLVSIEELLALRNNLSMAYLDQGFVNSGVVLPDQKISSGQIEFVEVRGSITQLDVSGNRALSDQYWQSQVERASPGTLQINQLQSALQVLEQHPLVRTIEAEIQPGDDQGEAVLSLNIRENRPWKIVAGIDNHRSPSLGEEEFTLSLAHLSLTGRGDRLEIFGNIADGLGDYGASYMLPLGSQQGYLRAYGSGGDAEIVEAPFDQIDIRSRTYTAGLEAVHPVWVTPAHSVRLSMGLRVQHSENTLLGMPFSFSLGEINGNSDTTAFILGGEWNWRGQDQVLALRVNARQGTDWFGAATNPITPEGLSGPETDFFAWQGQVQYVRRLPWLSSEVLIRSAWQLAKGPLLPVEKMPVGGMNSVRGYRENLLVRDNGLTASAEWRVPLFTADTATGGFTPRALRLAAFADFGQSWDQGSGLPSDQKTRISSVGLGLLWNPWRNLSVDVYYGHALEDLAGSAGNSLQEDGWHWRLGFQY